MTTSGTGVAGELRGWLTDRLALYLDRPAGTLDPRTPLAAYGMDSVCALSLCGDLEDEQGLIVASTLVFDHPTIDELVGYLSPLLGASARS
ncbi:acyl carrier protein [Streptomyces sp. ISL-43]|uniref:acyl carrier protein n=1 Tax=Streptomyces sp. ISL-43 TaxID=2819183 RepID=UPI001BE53602|nr:acyl carrier protein [Streptomyces sp. ISL-43]MBT2446399.1 acyl carrier protein [Streptomyces sp. ISL-43]